MKTFKGCTITLPYFKQGDDLQAAAARVGMRRAWAAHADMLVAAARQLRTISLIIGRRRVTVTADTHMIEVWGAADVIEKLVQRGLATQIIVEEGEDQ